MSKPDNSHYLGIAVMLSHSQSTVLGPGLPLERPLGEERVRDSKAMAFRDAGNPFRFIGLPLLMSRNRDSATLRTVSISILKSPGYLRTIEQN